MRETEFPVWVVETDINRFPAIKEYTGIRLNPQSVTVRAGGAVQVIKAAGFRKWFTAPAEATRAVREILVRLRQSLEQEAARVEAALAAESLPCTIVAPEAPVYPPPPAGWLDG